MQKLTAAVLEDDLAQFNTLKIWLNELNIEAIHATDGKQFLESFVNINADIVILDWEVPILSGFEVLGEIRNKLNYEGPVLFTTARTSEEDIVKGLNAGADDYFVKPLRKSEFSARLVSLLRRVSNIKQTHLTLGEVEFDLSNRTVNLSNAPVTLTSTEFDLAVFICSNVDKLLSREMLLQQVWGTNADLDTRTVDMYISRIRKLLNIQANAGYCIRSIYKHGYRLEAL